MNRTFLRHELLEPRTLLAGITDSELFCSPFQNPLDSNDLDNDGEVTPADALVAINTINSGTTGELSAAFAPPGLHGHVAGAAADYLDADGDGHLSAGDALKVINTINAGLRVGPFHNLPDADQQANTITAPADAEPAIGALDLSRGFARVLAKINTAGDVDVFRILPDKTQLNVTLFSANRLALTVSVVVIDATAPGGVATLATTTTEEGSRGPAKVNLDVEAGTEHFVIVQGVAADASGVYGLSALNFSPDQFQPNTDSELGDDQHGDTATTATALQLNNNLARVASNIDASGDADSFLVEVTDGKLIVSASARFDVSLEITRLDEGAASAAARVGAHRRIVENVTAGKYVVTVRAENGTDIGPYRLNVVNVPIPASVPHDHDDALAVLFARLDANDDAALTKAEAKSAIPLVHIPILDRLFDQWDDDGNGQLDFAEFEAGTDELHRRAVLHQPIRDLAAHLRNR